jgi:hypothetical protein
VAVVVWRDHDDLMISRGSQPAETLGLFLSFGFSGLLALLGWLAKHWPPALIIGMVAYALDSLVCAVTQQWTGVGVHLLGLIIMLATHRAYLKKTRKA